MSTFGQELVAGLLELREHAASSYVDTVRIDRQTGSTPDGMGGDTPVYSPVHSGPAAVQSQDLQAQNPTAGGHTGTVLAASVKLPVGAYRPQIGDLVTVTVAVLDPYLQGRVLRITALLHKTMATAYRLAAEDTAA